MITQIPRRLKTSGFFTCAMVATLSNVTCLVPFVFIIPKRAFAGTEVNLSDAEKRVEQELKIYCKRTN